MGPRVPSSTVPVTAKALLGLLSLFTELSAYELKKKADRTLRFFWSAPAMSQVYADLERLEELGWAASRSVAGPGRRTTRVFRVTAAGVRALRDWLDSEPVEPFRLRHPVALRVFLGHLVAPERLDDVVRAHREHIDVMAADLLAVRDSLRDTDPAHRLPIAVAEWGLDYYRGELRAVDRLLDLLAQDRDTAPAAPAAP